MCRRREAGVEINEGQAPKRSLPKRIVFFHLPPVTFFHYPAAVPVDPAMRNPMSMLVWRPLPRASLPSESVAVPSLVAWRPNISWSRRWNAVLDSDPRGRSPHDHIGGENTDRQDRREKSCDQTFA